MKRRNFLRGLLFAAMLPVAATLRVPDFDLFESRDPLARMAKAIAKQYSEMLDAVTIRTLKLMENNK